jgi:hypothetical protein
MFRQLLDLVRQARRPRRPGRPAPPTRRPARARPRLEYLETRLTPSAQSYLDSNGVLHVNSDNAGNTLWLDVQGVNTYVGVNYWWQPGHQEYWYYTSQVSSIVINGGAGADTVYLYGTLRPTTVNGQGPSTSVLVGDWGYLDRVLAPVTVNGWVALTVDASQDGYNQTVQLNASSLTGMTPLNTPINYGDVASLTVVTTQGNDTVTVTGTPRTGVFYGGVTLTTGSGSNVVNVQGLTAPIDGGWFLIPGGPLTVSSGAAATVNVGHNGSAQEIGSSLTVLNPPWYTTLNIDDSADGTYRNVTHDTTTIGPDYFGRIIGLAPAAIYYRYADTSAVTVRTGGGGPTVNVLATGVPLTLIGSGYPALTTVNVGNAAHGMQDIWGQLNVSNPPWFTVLNLDDRGDPGPRDVFESTSANTGRISGLAPADVTFVLGDLSSLDIWTSLVGTTTFHNHSSIEGWFPVTYHGSYILS